MPSLVAHRQTPPWPKTGAGQRGHFNMNGESHSTQERSWPAGQVSPGSLAALSRVDFSDCDTGEIFQVATTTVGNLAPCQVEASYRSVDGGFVRFPPAQPEHPQIERHLRESGCDGQVDVQGGRWGWALPLNTVMSRTAIPRYAVAVSPVSLRCPGRFSTR